MIKRILFTFLFLTLIAGCTVAAFGFNFYQGLSSPVVQKTQLFEVKEGDYLNRVLLRLQKKGWVTSLRLTRVFAQYKSLHQLKQGEFELSEGMSLLQVLEKLNSNEVVTYKITLIEGKTFKDYLTVLKSHEKVKQTLNGLSVEQIMDKVGAPGRFPEGLFFPDTYVFTGNTSDLEVLKRSYQKMEMVLSEEWSKKGDKSVVKTPYEALILASIVEKETGVAYERPEIAGVFTRRLIKGMRLQSDPTVIYGMGDRYQGNIRRKHLLERTPYNTYRINALPPTPIASPGREAINAVLNPAETKALYFVAKGDGSHHFSNTLVEHNKAVRKYQVFGRSKNYKSAPKND